VATKSTLLRWTGEGLEFEADGYGPGPAIMLDSKSTSGPSPMDALLMAIAGCMAIDVLMIAQKSRVGIDGLEVAAEGDRAEEDPRRYQSVRLVYRVSGAQEADAPRLQRAVDLSEEKYCSVLHTLRPDVEYDIRIERV
jgi:putative redox protein